VENPLGYSLRSLLLKGEEPCPLILAHGFLNHGFLNQSNLILFTALLVKNRGIPFMNNPCQLAACRIEKKITANCRLDFLYLQEKGILINIYPL